MSRTRSAPPAPAHPERSETVQMPRLATRLTSRGFSMVEALVALVVLGVGMLGIAGLYVTTLRTSSSAISRMQAVNLASDLGDRIRANRTAGAAYAGDAAENGDGCVGASAACSAQELAAHDLYVWEQQISATLPGGAGEVQVDNSTTPDTYTITITWSEPGEPSSLQYVMRMQI
ncbi:MAG: type IV pilus modification protein PilV [Steroidobacteraceae bacterium]|nr:type IV pilus modification protein PilV [Steroidobacteraceae bacterium]